MQAAIERDFFVNTKYILERADGGVVHSEIILLESGRIHGSTNSNETCWDIRDANLVLLDSAGQITTEFYELEIDRAGHRLFGRYLPEALDRWHILRSLEEGPMELPPIPTLVTLPPTDSRDDAQVAVLVRSHVVDAKFHDLWNALNEGPRKYDVFPALDRTTNRPELRFNGVVWHSIQECPSLGLHQRSENLFWLCGDMVLYFAIKKLPEYRYYVMLEYDVHFLRNAAEYMNRFCERLLDGGAELDGIGLNYAHTPQHYVPDQEQGWPFLPAAARAFPNIYYFYFPFIALSRRAVLHLFAERQLEAARRTPPDQVVHCEAFVPSSLKAAGMACADLNEVVGRSYELDLMGFNHQRPNQLVGLPLGFRDRLNTDTQMVHAVYSPEEFLRRNLALRYSDRSALSEYIDLVRAKYSDVLPPSLLNEYLGQAAARSAEIS